MLNILNSLFNTIYEDVNFNSRLFSALIYTLSMLVFFEVVREAFYLIKKTTTSTYFGTLCIVGFIIFSQTLLLLFVDYSLLSDVVILLFFIYATAIIILFLIYLALTTMESYHFQKQKSNELWVISAGNLASWVNFIFWSYWFAYSGKWLFEGYTLLQTSSVNADWLRLFDNKNLICDNVDFGVNPKVTILTNAANTSDLFIFTNDQQSNKNSLNWLFQSLNSFQILKKEIIDEVSGYILSTILQASCLIIVILFLLS